MAEKKKVTYRDVDKNLFGGLLPAGQPLNPKTPDPNVQNQILQQQINQQRQQQQQQQTIKEPVTTQTQTEVFRNETGRLAGATLPDGRTFLGLSPDEVRKLSKQQADIAATPEGAVEASKAAAQREQAALGAELAGQVGQIDPAIVAAAQAQGVDYEQALKSGAAGILPSLVGGAAGGAVLGAGVGAVGGAGVGAIPGAVIGGVGGALSGLTRGILSNLKGQTGDTIKAKGDALSKRKTALKALIQDTNQNPSNAATNLELFNIQLALIEKDFAALNLETQRDLNLYLGQDGTPKLMEYEVFYSVGGARDFYIRDMQTALLNPNPSKISLSVDDLNNE